MNPKHRYWSQKPPAISIRTDGGVTFPEAASGDNKRYKCCAPRRSTLLVRPRPGDGGENAWGPRAAGGEEGLKPSTRPAPTFPPRAGRRGVSEGPPTLVCVTQTHKWVTRREPKKAQGEKTTDDLSTTQMNPVWGSQNFLYLTPAPPTKTPRKICASVPSQHRPWGRLVRSALALQASTAHGDGA